MGFLDKFNDPNYTDANTDISYQRKRRSFNPGATITNYDTPEFGGGIRSRGMINEMGNRSPQQSRAGGGFGNADGSPNVVYDQGPEQFAAQMKLQKEQMANNNRYKDADLFNDSIRAQAALESARGLADSRGLSAQAALQRNEIARYKAMNPNHLIRETPNGYIAIDPNTNEVVSLGVQGLGMSKEDEINLRNKGALEQIGLRNEGSENNVIIGANSRERIAGWNNDSREKVAGMNNTSREGIASGQNQNRLDVTGLRNMGATNLEGIRQKGRMDLQNDNQDFTRSRDVFRQQGDTYSNVIKNELDPAKLPTAPTFPQFTSSASPVSRLGSGATPTLGNPMSFGGADGFSAKPGQFTAAEGQFTSGTPAAEVAAKGGNPQELEAEAKAYLESKGKALTPENLAAVVKALQAKKSGGGNTTSTTPAKPAAGQVTGPSAGTVSK